MKVCRVEELKENDILGRDVVTNEYQVLLSKGTVLKQEYIDKMKDFGIREVLIEDTYIKNELEEVALLKSTTELNFKNKVKDILEKHTYQNSKDLAELSQAADTIITDILQEKEVMEKVYDIKQRNADIYEHSVTICSLAIMIGTKLAISKESLHDIGVGCLLHDLGLRYLTVPYADRNIASMNERDAAEYKKHPIYGYTAVQEESWLSDTCKKMILFHHERIDGSGYPLHATEFSEECKILAVCDVFDEMLCGIGYEKKKAYDVVQYLKNNSNLYDKAIVEVLLEFTAVYPIGSLVVTNHGELGIVIRQNRKSADKPIVKVLKDSKGNEIAVDYTIDLEENPDVFISKVLE